MLQIKIICLGKTKEKWLLSGLEDYQKRLQKLCHFEWLILKESKSGSPQQDLKADSETLLSNLDRQAFLVLLDENGDSFSSQKFAQFFQKQMNQGISKIHFIIGGAYGFHSEIKKQIPFHLSLSSMTFTHQMIRLICVEQIYRAFCILNGFPYHH